MKLHFFTTKLNLDGNDNPSDRILARRMQNGFTLIELLVVISIIALLIAILLPALSKAREAGKMALCSTNQRSIAQVAVMYASDYTDHLPINETFSPSGVITDWRGKLAYYLDGIKRGAQYTLPKVYECPTKNYSSTSSFVGYFPEWPDGFRPGTGINLWLYRANIPVTLSQIVLPSDAFFTIDTLDHHMFTAAPTGSAPFDTNIGFHHGGVTGTRSTGSGVVRFGGVAITAFLDGHAKAVSVEDTGTLPTDPFWSNPIRQ